LKKYLSKKGIKMGAIVLAAVLLIALSARALDGRAGFFQNLSGSLKKPVQGAVGAVADWLEGIYGYMYKYDDLQAENESLKSQLAEAQAEARDEKSAAEENERLRNLLDFKEKHTDYELESAKIVARSASNWSSAYTIGKGSADGIKVGAPVITDTGVLTGTVKEVGTNWATVSTVIDAGTKIGATTSQSGSTGMIMGDYDLMQKGYAKLTYLPSDSQIFQGDTVLTSGVGGAFPEGLVVGTVDSVQTEAGGQVEYGLIKPGSDLNALVQVFVIKSYDVVN
jgi:rod shape-determining protein MreC